ncbi:tRNA 2-selenouridine(34) synthase MnmH [Desulfogranum mediterraneum]|uniref:tRNA 2-selenouridine(34) synthase MnmH n=1 Tax=Desulfogranum mediterraneum TaxID=160661 RepID=UPI00040599FD|nr:tRNA 2-selenouridine(34) synthase MnmH [Desulfogranum mediterraneum]
MNQEDDFQQLVVDARPLIDVRAPVEYERGTIPGAVNLPLMNNDERHRVGRCYKEQGSEAAVALGHRLVSGEVKAERIAAWGAFIDQHPDALLFCARGGMRSQISQEWIGQACDRSLPRLKGGYKAVRNFLLSRLEPARVVSKPVILGGRTGAGKTILLKKLANSIDLEGLAHHRGSSFGRFIDPQPSQADFENLLASALIRHDHASHPVMVLESEGTHVGRCYLPKELAAYFNTFPRVLLEVPLEERIQTTYEEYVLYGQQEYREAFGAESGVERWLETMLHCVDKIANRLGRERAGAIKTLQQDAHSRQLESGEADGHRTWIAQLLSDYYDPMYDHHIRRKSQDTIFRGDFAQVLDFLRHYQG